MTDSQETETNDANSAAERRNGLSPIAPNPDQLILVAGGGGYPRHPEVRARGPRHLEYASRI